MKVSVCASGLALVLSLSSCAGPAATVPSPAATPQAAASSSAVPSGPVPSAAPADPGPTSAPLPSRPSAPPSNTQELAQGNLIPNPGAEVAQGSQPANWNSDSWGELRAELSWRQDGAYSGQRYLAANVSNYGAEGDAKWFFDPVRLSTGQWYEYREQYRSDGRSRLLYSCLPPGGSRRFYNAWQSHASPGWQDVAFRFYLPTNCETTVVHALDRNGFLHTDHQQLRVVAPRPLKQALVSVSFDDIWRSAADVGARELEQRGFRGSFYVAGSFAQNPGEQYADEAAIAKLIEQGHEVGSHSFGHPNLSRLSQADQLADLRASEAFLTRLGISRGGIAYPFGDFDDRVETEAKGFHPYARTSLFGLNDAGADPYRLRIVPVTTETSSAELLGWIEAASQTKTWLILLFHDLGEPAPRNPYTTELSQYQQVLEELTRRSQAGELRVLTIRQALEAAGLAATGF